MSTVNAEVSDDRPTYPGAQAQWTEKLQLIHPHLYVKIPIYRVLDKQGRIINSSEEPEIN
ncbi:hypothetical protein L9F63_003163, partial [Diploptera punctata]